MNGIVNDIQETVEVLHMTAMLPVSVIIMEFKMLILVIWSI